MVHWKLKSIMILDLMSWRRSGWNRRKMRTEKKVENLNQRHQERSASDSGGRNDIFWRGKYLTINLKKF